MAQMKLIEPCRKCGGRQLLSLEESYRAWRVPGTGCPKKRTIRGPLGDRRAAAVIAGERVERLEFVGDIYQFRCEGCSHGVQVVEAQRADETIRAPVATASAGAAP